MFAKNGRAGVRDRELAHVADEAGGVGGLRVDTAALFRKNLGGEGDAERVAAEVPGIRAVGAAAGAGVPSVVKREGCEAVDLPLAEPDDGLGHGLHGAARSEKRGVCEPERRGREGRVQLYDPLYLLGPAAAVLKDGDEPGHERRRARQTKRHTADLVDAVGGVAGIHGIVHVLGILRA